MAARSPRAEGSAEETPSAPAAKVVVVGVGSPAEECCRRDRETDDGAHPTRAVCGGPFAGGTGIFKGSAARNCGRFGAQPSSRRTRSFALGTSCATSPVNKREMN